MEVALVAGDSRKEAVTRMTREGGARTEEVVMPERELAVEVASALMEMTVLVTAEGPVQPASRIRTLVDLQ